MRKIASPPLGIPRNRVNLWRKGLLDPIKHEVIMLEHRIKGNKDGIKVSKHIQTPSLAPIYAVLESRINKNKHKAEKKPYIHRLLRIISVTSLKNML